MSAHQHKRGVGRTSSPVSVVAHTVATECDALSQLHAQLPAATPVLLNLLRTATTIIFTGMGKSGHVARALAATFCSVGLPALFLHPAEALHGDLGVVRADDVCVMISKSGHGDELCVLAKNLARRNIASALLTSGSGALTKKVSLVVTLPAVREACPFDVVPTSSMITTLSFGHGIALQLAALNQFDASDFAQTHPAGSLGSTLLRTVNDCMTPYDQLPVLRKGATFTQVVSTMTTGCKGMALVCGDDRQLEGIITDGDLRRACRQGSHVFAATAADIMTTQAKTTEVTTKATQAWQLMHTHRITGLVVVDKEKKVVGFVHLHDIRGAGVAPTHQENQ